MEKLSLTGSSKHTVDDQMKGLSALFMDGENIFVDNGGIHAKSRLERGITFLRSLDEVQNPREILGFWITLHRFETGQGYYGAMPFSMFIDEEAKVGYKNLSQQVNHMEKAIKGKVDTQHLTIDCKARIAQFLQTVRPELWQNASPLFQEAFQQAEHLSN